METLEYLDRRNLFLTEPGRLNNLEKRDRTRRIKVPVSKSKINSSSTTVPSQRRIKVENEGKIKKDAYNDHNFTVSDIGSPCNKLDSIKGTSIYSKHENETQEQ